MKQPYQVVLDIWEASSLDVSMLLENGVAGLIVRLNDMQGGHHIDEHFTKNWDLAQRFPVQAIYSVYNPWVDGPTNYKWIKSKMPADYKIRKLEDVEVTYLGYSAAKYAAEVAKYTNLVKANNPVSIYTGEWFLNRLAYWPVNDVDYWWGAYPNVFTSGKSITWQQFHQALAGLKYAYNGAACPGGYVNVNLWQCSGGGILLPGMHKPCDVNVFPGTLTDLCNWMYIQSNDDDTVVKSFDERLTALEKAVAILQGNV